MLAQVAPGDIRARLPAQAPEDPEPFSAVLRDLDEILLPGVTHWQHPRFFAYFATSAAEPGILAELLAATLNSVGFLWRTAPASTELEGVVLDWTAQLLGLPDGWHGHIEDTASTGTMAAMIAARETTGRNEVVCSEHTHSAVEKGGAHDRHDAAQGRHRRPVPPARRRARRSEPDAPSWWPPSAPPPAPRSIRSRRSPTPARAAGTWLHVDGAYAGSAMVCPEFRWAFDGVERADSLVVNPHKWLLTPMDCSLLWTSRPADLRAAFSLVPEFLRTPDAEDALSLSEYGPALGRRFRALKLWAILRCYGRSGLQEHIRRGVALAELFESWVAAEPGWELCAPRHFSLVCFRLEGDDERSQAVLERVNAGGEMFLSHAALGGRYVLRLAVGQMSTTEDDVRLAWDVLRREAAGV